MKIIDLLNKIANGEEPKIKYDNVILKYNKNEKRFIDKDRLNSLYEIDFSELNDEVEILEEEKKIPEKIKSNGKEFYCDNIDSWIDKEKTSAYCEYLMNKYNDLIDYLKSKGE